MPEQNADDIFTDSDQDLERRLCERSIMRAALEPLLQALAKAEEELSPLSIFGTEDRRRLAQARVEILGALCSLDLGQSAASHEHLDRTGWFEQTK